MSNIINRRTFLTTGACLLGASAILPQLSCTTHKNMVNNGVGFDQFGIQLFTVRYELPKDALGLFSKLAKYGYKQLEGFEGDKGLWWGFGHKDFKNRLSDLGLNMVSSHCNYTENLRQKADQAAEAGLSYLVCPWVGPQKSMNDWKTITDSFNKAGEICKSAGIKFAYHNHEYSFKAFSGMIPHDFIMDNTDAALVDFEMDIYWVVTAGGDPIQFLKKYKNRFRLCHIKDRMKGSIERDASCDLGEGMVDFKSILPIARSMGMKYFLVEQERYDGSTPLQSVERNAKYMQSFRFV